MNGSRIFMNNAERKQFAQNTYDHYNRIVDDWLKQGKTRTDVILHLKDLYGYGSEAAIRNLISKKNREKKAK